MSHQHQHQHHAHDDGHAHAHHAHTHGHGHGHEHGHGHDYASSNRDFFDNLASTYEDRPLAIDLTTHASQAFLKEYAFDKDKTRVLDFACGTGLITRNIFPYVHEVVGVDISQGMIEAYTQKAEKAGLPMEKIRAFSADLLKNNKTEATPDEIAQLGGKFDVIVCSAAYHHLPSIQTATQVLASLLKPGGVLLVADFDINKAPSASDADDVFATIVSPTPQPFHPANFFDEAKVGFKKEDIVPHDHGISLETIKEVFESAGLHEVSVKRRIRADGTAVGDVPAETNYIFVAKGVKA